MAIDFDEFKTLSPITLSTGGNSCVDNLRRALMKNIVTGEEASASAIYRPNPNNLWVNRLIMGNHQELLWAKFEPGSIYRLHSHPYEQTSVVVQGRMRLTVGEEVREVGPGDMWHALPNVPHGGEILGDEAVIFIDVYSPPSEGDTSSVTYYD